MIKICVQFIAFLMINPAYGLTNKHLTAAQEGPSISHCHPLSLVTEYAPRTQDNGSN